MNKQQALEKYYQQKIKREILQQYTDADTEIIVNDDPDLIPIPIPIPECPDWHLIEGFGLPAREQKWVVPKIPATLLKLQKECDTIEEIYSVLEKNQQKFESEIKFIQTMWFHRDYGYWFFNNGKPTYISGCHFYFLFCWELDSGLPKYRHRDKKFWVAEKYFYDHTFDFKNKDKDGWAIQSEDGTYEFIDKGKYTLSGLLYPKFRREGATYRACCRNNEIISRIKNAQGGIQSRDDDDAYNVFKIKLVHPFKKLPFFFKPLTVGRIDPETKLQFDATNLVVKGGSAANLKSGLGSFISFATGNEGAYDSQKLQFYHRDEVAKQEKKTGVDINTQWNRTKECLWLQLDRCGWSWFTSTVGEMTKGGGEQFEKLAKASNFYQRNKNGRTASGLVLLFISSAEGYIIDEYGNSLKEESIEAIEAERKSKLDQGDIEGWAEVVRQLPLYYNECYTSDSKDNSYNIYIIESRLKQLRANTSVLRKGEFYWENGFGSRVLWRDVATPNPKWNLSYIIHPDQTNRKVFKDGCWWPLVPGTFEMGVDPFRSDVTISGKMSNGAAWVFMPRDKSIDPDLDRDGNPVPIDKWTTHRGVADYINRPKTKEEFSEDMLMAAIYFGVLVYYENNCDDLEKHFTDWGYKGFLKYDLDPKGRIKEKAGYYATGDTKEAVYNYNRDYIEKYGSRELHFRYLMQAKGIKDYKDLNNWDLIAAAGICFKGMLSRYTELVKPNEVTKDIGNYVKVRYV